MTRPPRRQARRRVVRGGGAPPAALVLMRRAYLLVLRSVHEAFVRAHGLVQDAASTPKVKVPKEVVRLVDRATRTIQASADERLERIPGISAARVAGGEALVREFRARNVRLIKTLAQEHLGEVAAVLQEQGNLHTRDLTKALAVVTAKYGLSTRRAEFWAVDQTLKLHADVVQAKHQSLGIVEYVWRTSRDSAVREAHAKLEGKTFRYDDPPVADENGERANPGKRPRCRCHADPVLPKAGVQAKPKPKAPPKPKAQPKPPPKPEHKPEPVRVPPPKPKAQPKPEPVQAPPPQPPQEIPVGVGRIVARTEYDRMRALEALRAQPEVVRDLLKAHPLEVLRTTSEPGILGSYARGDAVMHVAPPEQGAQNTTQRFAKTPVERAALDLTHELGHHAEEMLGHTPELRAAYAAAKARGKAVSKYALANEHEYYAETWTAYAHAPERLRKLDPEGFAAMQRVAEALKQAPTRSPEPKPAPVRPEHPERVPAVRGGESTSEGFTALERAVPKTWTSESNVILRTSARRYLQDAFGVQPRAGSLDSEIEIIQGEISYNDIATGKLRLAETVRDQLHNPEQRPHALKVFLHEELHGCSNASAATYDAKWIVSADGRRYAMGPGAIVEEVSTELLARRAVAAGHGPSRQSDRFGSYQRAVEALEDAVLKYLDLDDDTLRDRMLLASARMKGHQAPRSETPRQLVESWVAGLDLPPNDQAALTRDIMGLQVVQ